MHCSSPCAHEGGNVCLRPAWCRAAYPKVSKIGARLIDILQSRPQHQAIDMSEVCMCETIDALGLAGFDKAFHSVEAISNVQRAEMLDVSELCMTP